MIDIKQHIGQILYERDSLIIPELGGFVSSYKAAMVDHVQGLIHPPSKKISFNKNLLINDGVLIVFLQKELNVPLNEAKKSIEDFVHRTTEILNNREIVVFPGVGRLYKDYENNLQFLQDHTNYNTTAFGLPTLQFYPILRGRPSGNLAPETMIPKQSASRAFDYRKAANAIIPFAMIAIITLGALLYINPDGEVSADGVKTMPVAENRINQKPGEQLSIIDGIKNQFSKTAPVEQEEIFEEPLDEDLEEDVESSTLAPEMKECVIIIGAFGKKAGVRKRVKQIVDLGYSVYQDKKGGLTRVGIQFAYQYDIEVREKLEIMRDNFDNRSWVLDE